MSEIIVENQEETSSGEVSAGNPALTVPTGVILTDSIGKMFDLKPSEMSRYKTKINTLIAYAKLKTDDHSPQGLKWAIRNLETKLGTPALGEKLINYLTRYAYLYLESKNLEKELGKYHDRG